MDNFAKAVLWIGKNNVTTGDLWTEKTALVESLMRKAKTTLKGLLWTGMIILRFQSRGRNTMTRGSPWIKKSSLARGATRIGRNNVLTSDTNPTGVRGLQVHKIRLSEKMV